MRGFSFLILLFLQLLSAQAQIQSSACHGLIQGTVSNYAGWPTGNLRLVAYPLNVELGVLLPTTTTTRDGRYRFQNLCFFSYAVFPHDRRVGYSFVGPSEFSFLYGRPAPQISLTSEHPSANLRLLLPPKPGRIHIRVVDEGKTRLRKFKVKLHVRGQSVSPDLESWFDEQVKEDEILVPPNEPFNMLVTAGGFTSWEATAGRGKLPLVLSGESIAITVKLHRSKE